MGSTRHSASASPATWTSSARGQLEATNYFFSIGDEQNVLELTYNHDGRTYDLGTGYGHIAIGVDDLDGTLAQLSSEHGIEPERPPYQVREGGSRICFVRDPDDYRIELIGAQTTDGPDARYRRRARSRSRRDPAVTGVRRDRGAHRPPACRGRAGNSRGSRARPARGPWGRSLVGECQASEKPVNQDTQLTLMNARVIALIARERERWPLAGDQLYVDLDLRPENLPAGTRLALGSAVIEVTDEPHTGCAKFTERFGSDAIRFVNSAAGRARRLRGMNARWSSPGESGQETRSEARRVSPSRAETDGPRCEPASVAPLRRAPPERRVEHQVVRALQRTRDEKRRSERDLHDRCSGQRAERANDVPRGVVYAAAAVLSSGSTTPTTYACRVGTSIWLSA